MRDGAADRGGVFGSSGMQCDVVAVRIARGRDMTMVGRIDRRSMHKFKKVRTAEFRRGDQFLLSHLN